jgi:hypothetical protein
MDVAVVAIVVLARREVDFIIGGKPCAFLFRILNQEVNGAVLSEPLAYKP